MDCFASLAMTKKRSHCDKSTRRANHPKVCPALRAKIFRLTRRANQCSFFARLTADEGRLAIVTNVRWDAVDVKCVADERALSVRRSRVVLTPRCWCQVFWEQASQGRRWQKSRSPGRAR